MKKNLSISKVAIYMLLLLVILAAYFLLYFVPAQGTLTSLQAETSLHNAEAAIYNSYLADHAPLEADIEAIQREIDELNTKGYTNDSNVSFEINNAIQRYRITLSSVSLQEVSEFEGHRVLPINLKVSGEMNNLLKFIKHFEDNKNGSYLVQGTKFEINGDTVIASMVIYLCTPNV